MKAFKPFAIAPDDQRPEGIPGDWPWQVEDISDDEETILKYRELNFKVMTEDEFTEFLAARQQSFDDWAAAQPKKLDDVTPRQFRQAMVLLGYSVQQVEDAIAQLPPPYNELAKIEWEYSLMFIRTNPLVTKIGGILNLTNDQIDQLWIEAAKR